MTNLLTTCLRSFIFEKSKFEKSIDVVQQLCEEGSSTKKNNEIVKSVLGTAVPAEHFLGGK